MDLTELSVIETVQKIKRKEISCREVIENYINRIKKIEPEINAFMEVFVEESLNRADILDKKIKENEIVGNLAGIPVALKDNISIKGKKLNCSSKILQSYIAPYNATVTEKLISEDAILIGRTNMDEFAMGSSTENSAFKTTKNPHNTSRVPGGSSGGSAAAVAANMCCAALGSDTGGSIRQPASFCGIVGMKPTYGRVSRYGLVAFASSLDQIGPLTKNVSDNALILKVISGFDRRDSTSINIPVPDYPKYLDGNIKGIKIGVPVEYFRAGIDKSTEKVINKVLKKIEDEGVKIEEIHLPNTEYSVAVYYIIASSEASSNLARYDGIKYGNQSKESETLFETYCKSRAYGFGKEVKRRIILGTYSLSAGYYDAYYLRAQKVRTLIKKDFLNAFQKVDFIVSPTSPTTAFKIGEKINDPLKMYLSDIFTIPCNLAGLPGISIPVGKSEEDLPVGLQIIGQPFKEEILFKFAYGIETIVK